jgi:sulfite oxidase
MTQLNNHRHLHIHDSIQNGGPPNEQVASDFITPTELFFVRNHAPIPQVDPSAYRLRVHGLVQEAITLSLQDLHANYSQHTVTATLQCAGNRRKQLAAQRAVDDGLAWDVEAIATATWGGARLSDVLRAAGVSSAADAAHVAFLGLDPVQHTDAHGQTYYEAYGSSIELAKALAPAGAGDVLLAYKMNGEPLPAAHGGPLRVVVPGYIGARSVKWLSEISVQAQPSENYYQQIAYKLFPPDVREQTVNYDEGLMLTRYPVNSAIVRPGEGARLPAGRVLVEGYAMGDGQQPIAWVEVSADDGQTWQRAEFTHAPQQWAWQLWRSEFTLGPGPHTLVVRARDAAGNTQPEAVSSVWNFKGYANNSWHRVQIHIK